MESHLVTDGHTYSADYWHEMPAPQVGWEVLVQQPHIIEVGDIVHVQGGSLYSRAIRWVTRSSTEGPSQPSQACQHSSTPR